MDASSTLAISTVIIKIKSIRRTTYRRPIVKKGPITRINNQINALEVRVIRDADGAQLGILPLEKALELAREEGLDLVEIAPHAKPPVCKIMDFGKFQYQKSRLEKANKAKQKKSEMKGIRLGMRTDVHDREFKKTQAEKFLKKGAKVKIELTIRGREKAHQDLAKVNLKNFVESLSLPYKIEQEIKRYPGGFNIIIAPED